MAQQVKTIVTKPDNLGLVPTTHMAEKTEPVSESYPLISIPSHANELCLLVCLFKM